jgi:hypothetical protein
MLAVIFNPPPRRAVDFDQLLDEACSRVHAAIDRRLGYNAPLAELCPCCGQRYYDGMIDALRRIQIIIS